MHHAGGIGKSIESVEQLEQLQRPLTMETGGIVLMDLLWRCVHGSLIAGRRALLIARCVALQRPDRE